MPLCEKGFEVHLPSDSEHELTDPYTSLCCLGFPLHLLLRCTVCVRRPNTSFCWCAGPAQRDVLLSPVCAGCRSQAVQADFVSCCMLLVFFTAIGHSRVLEHATPVVSVADAACLWLGDRERKTSRSACPVVQRSVHSRSVGSQHPEESTVSLVLSLRDTCEESRTQRMRLQCSFSLALSGSNVICCVHVCAWLRRTSDWSLSRCLVQTAHCLFGSLRTYTVSPAVCSSCCWCILILWFQNLERVLLNTIHKHDE